MTRELAAVAEMLGELLLFEITPSRLEELRELEGGHGETKEAEADDAQ